MIEPSFAEVEQLIAAARARAYQAVNSTLIDLYWQIGGYISRKIADAEWGDAVIPRLAAHIAQSHPGLRGFTRVNLFRMRQFFEAYQGDEIVSPLVRQLPWSHHLIILGQSRRPEEREFYIRRAVSERWSKRELERQFKAGLFERTVLAPAKVAAALRHHKPHENPAVGMLLCASKGDEVVEYALSRTLSPALVAEYQTHLPDKALLRAKLQEFYRLGAAEGEP